jgi:simple sugar transport system permease protein
MKQNERSKKEPLFHIVKRDNISTKKKIAFYAGAIFLGLVVGGIICSLFSSKNPIDFFGSLFAGAFGTSRRIWLLLQETALLLGVSLALAPAFKMKFWNLGGNGQILMGCLSYIASMFYLGGKLPDILVMIIGLVAGVVAGAIWALIPAIFKAFFNTNESLFTLMMNYIASGLVGMFITLWVKTGSGVLTPLSRGAIPEIGNRYILTVVVFFLLAVAMYIYLKYSKQGYEISVVGESNNTAKYIGINVRRVIIRTMIISGAFAGLVGAFIGGAIDHTVSTTSASNMGFTAIMTSWLAAFNPLIMIASCIFITFVSKGMTQVRKDFKFTNDAISNIVIGIVYFAVIAVTFFLSYKIIFRGGLFGGKKKEKTKVKAKNEKEGA